MAPKHKTSLQPKGQQQDNVRPTTKEQELKTELEAIKKEFSRQRAIHKEELRAASTSLDGPSQEHYVEVMNEREELRERIKELQDKLDKSADNPSEQTKTRPAQEPQPSSAPSVVAPQGLSHKDHILQLIDQYTHRTEKLRTELEQTQKTKEKLRAAIALKKQEIHGVKMQARATRNQASYVPLRHTSDLQIEPSTEQGEPPALSSAAAFPSLPIDHGVVHTELSATPVQGAYSQAGGKAQVFTFVKTHVDKGDGKKAKQNMVEQQWQDDGDVGEE